MADPDGWDFPAVDGLADSLLVQPELISCCGDGEERSFGGFPRVHDAEDNNWIYRVIVVGNGKVFLRVNFLSPIFHVGFDIAPDSPVKDVNILKEIGSEMRWWSLR